MVGKYHFKQSGTHTQTATLQRPCIHPDKARESFNSGTAEGNIKEQKGPGSGRGVSRDDIVTGQLSLH